MSFGDLARGTPPLSRPTPASELQGSLNALAANNAALRRTSQLLRSRDPTARPPLNRVRELREQNRDIARAAAHLATRVDDARARAKFQTLVEEFSGALKESVQAESDALGQGEAGRVLTENEVAVREEEKARVEGENEPLLRGGAAAAAAAAGTGGVGMAYTAEEAAVLREIRGNEAFVRERNAVLTEIQSSVDDVNSIFKDLAVMVGDQRSQVDYVEVAVGDTVENVTNARRELMKTHMRRESRRSFFFCTLLTIAAIIALCLIILFH